MSEAAKMSTSMMVKWIVAIAVPIIIYLIPVDDVYTRQMSLFIATTAFALILMAFEFFEPIVIAILMPMSWVLLGVCDAASAMSGWMSTIIPMVCGAFFLANALDESQLLRRMAMWIMSKAKGSWLALLYGLFVAGVAINIVTFGSGFIIMATLCIALVKALELKPLSRGSALIGISCMLGTCTSKCFTYSASAYAVVSSQAALVQPGFNVTILGVTIDNLPMLLIAIIVMFVLYKIWKPEEAFGDVDYFKNELESMGQITMQEKKALVYLIILFAILLTAPITGADIYLTFALTPWVLLLPGVDVATSKSIREINWQNLFFAASCISIGAVATKLGIGQLVANVATPLLSGTNVFGFFVVIFLIVFVLNFFMTPLAIWGLMTAPLCAVAVNMGISVESVAYAMVMCSEAIILPYEYIPYLIIFSYGFMSMADFVKMNAVRSVIHMVGIIVLLVPWWMLVGVL